MDSSGEIKIEDIKIRNHLLSGDIGYITHLHGTLYNKKYSYGITFETYVAAGLNEFYQQYNFDKNRAWICEHENKIIGFILLIDKIDSAQLRFFLIAPEYRGIGLGNKLMKLFIDFLKSCEYKSCYLWTTSELTQAINLYIKYGFRLTEEKDTETFGKKVTEQKYELTL